MGIGVATGSDVDVIGHTEAGGDRCQGSMPPSSSSRAETQVTQSSIPTTGAELLFEVFSRSYEWGSTLKELPPIAFREGIDSPPHGAGAPKNERVVAESFA